MRGVTLDRKPASGRQHRSASWPASISRKTVLELGSNDAYIVLEDADLDKAVKTCVMGRIYNNGETCIAAKRFVVVDAIYDAFRDKFVEAMQAINIGDPTGDDVKMGPMAREDLRDDLHDQVEQSVQNGAKILCGGEVPDRTGGTIPRPCWRTSRRASPPMMTSCSVPSPR